jgi:enterochelin esterase family protein
MRSTEYDTVSECYALPGRRATPAVAKQYNLRTDAYSRAVTGMSSGICSFNAAWRRPEDFSRVISWIGSFT